jgi:hypothetical protein
MTPFEGLFTTDSLSDFLRCSYSFAPSGLGFASPSKAFVTSASRGGTFYLMSFMASSVP